MDNKRLGIGDFAAATGLTPRALRLYDEAGALVPAWVDPHTGYRTYLPSQLERAELIRLLRAGGVAVADLRAVLETTPGAAAALLDAHLRHAEELHARARAAIQLALTHLTTSLPGALMSRTAVSREVLLSAVRAAARCCAADPEPLPSLTGIRLRIHEEGLQLAGTDRYSAAFVDVPSTWDVVLEAERLVPAGFLLAAADSWPDEVTVELHRDGLLVAGVQVPTIEEAFPNLDAFRPFLAGLEVGCTVDTSSLLDALPASEGPGDEEPTVVLAVDAVQQELVVSLRGREIDLDDTTEIVRLAAAVRGPMETSWVSPARLRGILELVGDKAVLALASTSPLAIAPEGDTSRAFLLMPMASAETERALARR